MKSTIATILGTTALALLKKHSGSYIRLYPKKEREVFAKFFIGIVHTSSRVAENDLEEKLSTIINNYSNINITRANLEQGTHHRKQNIYRIDIDVIVSNIFPAETHLRHIINEFVETIEKLTQEIMNLIPIHSLIHVNCGNNSDRTTHSESFYSQTLDLLGSEDESEFYPIHFKTNTKFPQKKEWIGYNRTGYRTFLMTIKEPKITICNADTGEEYNPSGPKTPKLRIR